MRKQVTGFFQKGLCGILSVAMILTSAAIPELSVFAAQPAVEETAENADGTPSKENNDAVPTPDAGEDDAAVVENGTENDASGQDDESSTEVSGGGITEEDDVTTPEEDAAPDDEQDSDIKDDTPADDATEENVEDDDLKTVSDEEAGLYAASDTVYTNQTVSLDYYVGELNADETVGFYLWSNEGGSITVDTDVHKPLSWGGWGNPTKNPVYEMHTVTGHTGWYHITFSVTDTITIDSDTGAYTNCLAGFHIFKSSDVQNSIFKCDVWIDNSEIYPGLLSGDITAVKDGKGYASIDDAEVSTEALETLVAEAKKLKEEDYKPLGWAAFAKELIAAEAVLVQESPAASEIEEAYENLEKAMDALVPKSTVEAEINVKPVALADDFITGADISSYWSLRQSGTVFKDEEGNELSDAEFFKYLHDGGTNWVRIRVWNDPYDSAGHGYGSGNNDVAKAKIMGKLATDAGMRVLIDFHYSDFWADPGKQQAPKAWKDLSVDDRADAVYQFTKASLDDLKAAGVDVGMVQVGNETTNGICGVSYKTDGWAAAAKIYNAGSKAVREFDEDCLVAVHFTNPERSGNYASLAGSLDAQKVDYDVFASSYYPFWHGTTDNLTTVLANVAKTYGKKVMVAETSWATTLDDQDGHENTVRKGNNDSGAYAISIQGQADEIRAVVEAANKVNSVDGAAGSSIGVFYWESAWLSPYYVYNEDGTRNEELYQKNKDLWEEYGSGWAASYGGDYDPDDAGKWYGGSAVDNQAWFGFDGAALPTAKIYSYIRTGALAEKAVADVVNPSITVDAGKTFTYPEKVTVNFNDGTSDEYAVVWNEEDQAQVDTKEPGDHTVRGIVTCEYTISDGSTRTATRSVTLTITVEMALADGLVNPGFEDADMSAWTITGSGTARKSEDPHSGTYGMHFYNASAVTSTVMQKIENIDAGIYIFGGYIQGNDGTTADAVVKVYDQDGNEKAVLKQSCSLAGWAVWQNPEIVGIVVAEGDYIEVGMEVAATAGGWGTIDDFYLYQAYEYAILIDDQMKHGTLTSDLTKSVSGETITVTATPDEGYILSKLTISGRSVTADTLTSSHGTVTYDAAAKTAVLTYSDKVTEETEESFTMPNGKVTVSAVFRTDVDISALDELIAEYEDVTNDGYTAVSWGAFTTALEAAQAVVENADATQTEIDSAKEALEAAYAGLTKESTGELADLTALNALIAQYEDVTNDGYTAASWKTFTDALAAAKTTAAKENVTQAEADDAEEVLVAAYTGLAKESIGEPADLTTLNALIAGYEDVTNDGYTAASWKTFTDALAAAKTTAAKENVTQAEADSAKEALEAAYEGLTKESTGEPTDLTALNALIAQYEDVANDGYTAASWKTFTDALAAAKTTAAKENVTQAEADDAEEALAAAYTGLTKESMGETVDLTALNALIVQYENVTNDGYTAASWKIFTDALTAAKTTAAKENVTQVEIDDAKDALEAAYTGLTKESTGEPADLTALHALIAQYEAVDNDGYTEASWKTFTDALEAAKTTAAKADVTQAEADNAKEALEAAYTGLTKEAAGEPADLTTLNALIAGYEVVTNDGYTQASWKIFADALEAAKTTVAKENVTQAEVDSAKDALEAAYAGLTKEAAGEPADLTALHALIAQCESVTNDGYTAASWKTFADALEAAKTTAAKENVTQAEADSAREVLETAYNGLAKAEPDPAREGLWAEWTQEWAELLNSDNTITYTGKALKPTVKVYDGETLLTNKSYSVSYKNNTKVGTASVIIKGKGNYTGDYTMNFRIDYVDLEKDDNVSIADVYAAASKNGNPVNVKPVVTWNGKKVSAKLYEVVLSDTSAGAYVNPGTYDVEVKAKANNGIYKGSRMIKLTLADTNSAAPQVLMSNVKIKLNFKSKQWTETVGGITLNPEDISVTYKNENLVLNENYTLDYENNEKIGTATVIVTGTGTPENSGRFVGEQRKTFKITGTAIKAKDVRLEEGPFVYDGTVHEPKVTIDGLTEDSDFTVAYQNNINAGKKATAVITGINAYSGTVKKTFTISSHDVNQTDFIVEIDKSVPYEKGGSKPTVKVSFDGDELVQGVDYTVSYAKNTKLTEGATAEVRIKGKGNYTKTKTEYFEIVKQDLENLTADAADQTSPNKWNKVSPVITDRNGKALKKGTDYEKTFTYVLYAADGTRVTDTSATLPAVGMKVEVTALGKGNYEGGISAEFRIIDSKKSIAKARIKVTPQIYTGDEIELSKSDIVLELKENGVWVPIEADQYEILGYSNNINKGKKAKVTIHGLSSYGGTKVFNFEIRAQSMEGMNWAERIASMFEILFN